MTELPQPSLCKRHHTKGESLVCLRNEKKIESDKLVVKNILQRMLQQKPERKACGETPERYEKPTKVVLKINMVTALESLLENVNSSVHSLRSASKATSE